MKSDVPMTDLRRLSRCNELRRNLLNAVPPIFTRQKLTKGCLQITQMMLLAASLDFDWLFAPPVVFPELRSRFCAALAPCRNFVSQGCLALGVNAHVTHECLTSWKEIWEMRNGWSRDDLYVTIAKTNLLPTETFSKLATHDYHG